MIRTPENDAEAYALFWNSEVDGFIPMPGESIFEYESWGLGWIKDLRLVGLTGVYMRFADINNLKDSVKPTLYARETKSYSSNGIFGSSGTVNPALFKFESEPELFEIASLMSVIKFANEQVEGDYVLYSHADFVLTAFCQIASTK